MFEMAVALFCEQCHEISKKNTALAKIILKQF
jgi:hypothetical protein